MNLPNPFPGLAVNAAAVTQISTSTSTSTSTQASAGFKFKKAGTAGVLISVVLDESGSMASCRDTTIIGFNEFVQGQKAVESTAGAGYLNLVKFEGGNVTTVFANRPLVETPLLDRHSYTPRGGTNLLDAIGDTINMVNTALASKKKKDRPGVIITIITDGEENSSRRFNNTQIKEMVAAAEKANWSFVFLGANIDSFSVGSTFGMRESNSVNYSTSKLVDTMASVSASTTRMRMAKSAGLDAETIYNNGLYTSAELKNMK